MVASWGLLVALLVVAIIALGISAVVLAGIGLAVGWGLVAHVIMGDNDVNGRKDP
jgi:hypothetical protein